MTESRGEATYRKIVRGMIEVPGVSEGTGFGSNRGLRYRTKIFAMLGNGSLVLKLPKERVDGLVSAGAAKRFDPRRDGRLMKEWTTVSVDRSREWKRLAEEALAFARSAQATARRS